jgi:hypothetical protein
MQFLNYFLHTHVHPGKELEPPRLTKGYGALIRDRGQI